MEAMPMLNDKGKGPVDEDGFPVGAVVSPEERKAARQAMLRRVRRNGARRAKNEVMRSLGLVRVKGALGGTYWE
jgi:hypothetical protein